MNGFVAVKQEAEERRISVVMMMTSLLYWVFSCRRNNNNVETNNNKNNISVSAQRLRDSNWLLRLRVSGQPFSVWDLRRLMQNSVLNEAIRTSAEVCRPKPYLVKCASKLSNTVLFLPLHDGADLIVLDQSDAVFDNEISFCFSRLENRVDDVEVAKRLEELLLARFAKDFEVELHIEGHQVARLPKVLSSHNSCWMGGSSYTDVSLGLFAACPGETSMSFFNGSRPIAGQLDDQHIASISDGLLAGKMEIMTRTEPVSASRRCGEWTRLKEAALPFMLLVVVSMRTKDGWTVDGTSLAPDCSERLASCCAVASTSLSAQLALRERELKRQANAELVRTTLAAQCAQIFETCLARAPESSFSKEAMEMIRDAAFHHEQTAAAVIERTIKET